MMPILLNNKNWKSNHLYIVSFNKKTDSSYLAIKKILINYKKLQQKIATNSFFILNNLII